jgi:hypothetical protein
LAFKEDSVLKNGKLKFLCWKENRKAVSPAISTVIIIAATIVLVLVASSYAYQVLERQKGASEFDAIKKSFITFDDAIRDIAWDKGGARSTRFTANYGILEVIPANVQKGLPINVTIEEYPTVRYMNFTGYLRYNLSTYYITFGNGYRTHLFGDDKTLISKGTENFGTAIIEQQSKWVSLTLFYRVKVSRTAYVKVGTDYVNYIEILIIKITTTQWTPIKGDLDLAAKNNAIITQSYGPYNAGNKCTISVQIGGLKSTTSINLEPGKVVFNFIIAEVYISA